MALGGLCAFWCFLQVPRFAADFQVAFQVLCGVGLLVSTVVASILILWIDDIYLLSLQATEAVETPGVIHRVDPRPFVYALPVTSDALNQLPYTGPDPLVNNDCPPSDRISVTCLCGSSFRVPVSFAGMMRPCPNCGRRCLVASDQSSTA
jgi:hypothetical protein